MFVTIQEEVSAVYISKLLSVENHPKYKKFGQKLKK
jgi:hypothetical protein